MNISRRLKWIILAGTIVGCIAGGVVVVSTVAAAPALPVIFAVLTIVLPVVAALFVYKGKLAYWTFGFAVVMTLCAVIITIDLVATRTTFEYVCEERHLYEFKPWQDSYMCEAQFEPMEPNTFFGEYFSVTGLPFFIPYFLMVLVSLVNVGAIPAVLLNRQVKK